MSPYTVKAAAPTETYKISYGHRPQFSSGFATSTSRNDIMNFLNLVWSLVLGASSVAGASRYIAIPIDEIDIIEVNPVMPQAPRYPRQTETYVPALVSGVHNEELEQPGPRVPRSDAHILDYVDFGAHTGNNGAYSWYADYPTQR